MQAFHQQALLEHTVPAPWDTASEEARSFVAALRASPRPVLILDYDGTLAPFRENKMEAVPYPGVVELLEQIVAGRTQVAFLSGRPSAELIQLLPLTCGLEIWGMHGREHRSPDGVVRLIEPNSRQVEALDSAENQLRSAVPEGAIERKVASVAVHWRAAGEETPVRKQIEEAAMRAFSPYAGRDGLAVLPFDGGLELRSDDRTKQHGAEDLLAAAHHSAASAFLGDDTTDEDAFRAVLAVGGLPLLVREPPRPSFARFVLRPPEQLLKFLEQWAELTG